MLAALVAWQFLTGRVDPNPLPEFQLPHRLDQVPLRHDIDRMRRELLERTRDRRVGLEETIRMYEGYLKEPNFFTPAKAAYVRQMLDEWREHVRDQKEFEQELERWERERKANPGPRTDEAAVERLRKLLEEQEARKRREVAPPPREKK